MAFYPMMFNLADDLDRFSLGAVTPYYNSHDICPYIRPNNQLARHSHHGTTKFGQLSKIGKDGFQVCMDVAQFKPSELNVKVVDKHIIIEGKHEEREDDHGYITRHFIRRYGLPKGYDSEKVISTLSSDGVLTVSVPKPQIEDKCNERVVQIQQVGPAHLNVKENPKEIEGEKKKEEPKA
ncbi:heat shock protein 23 [Teleopsis dalmanni]|uniref:heat shock protein 23 n=1 Tax=Teleopsis dalmanni TaxID=139649 RepID=UPI0018CF62F2|nr:heat shock protein 23 [Teleopsis dalmanni]